jgi:phage terminase small subunit
MAELTEKQRLFALEYLANGFKAKEAALKVGYKESTADVQASRLLSLDKIKNFILEQQKGVHKKKGLSHEYLVDNLMTILNEAMKPGQWKSPKNAMKAIELLGKHINLFDADNRSKTPVVNIPFIEWSDGEGKD